MGRCNPVVLQILLVLCLISPHVSTEPRNCGNADVVIGVDGSWSINFPDGQMPSKDFETGVLPFVHQLVSSLDELNFRIGFFAWSTRTKLIFGIDEDLTRAEQLQKIDATPYLAQNTWTGSAIKFGVEMLVDHNATKLPAVPKVLVIMTDGEPFPLNQTGISVEMATTLYYDKYNIFPIAVGVGDYFIHQGLLDITRNNDTIFTADTFSDLAAIATKIKELTCYVPEPLDKETKLISQVPNFTKFFSCSKTRGGLQALFSVTEGTATAYYSFRDKPQTLTAENNQGTLESGVATELPVEEDDKGQPLYIMVETGPEVTSTYEISCSSNPTEPVGGTKCGMADVVIGIDASWSIEFPDRANSSQRTNNFQNKILPFTTGLIKLLDEDRYRTGFFVWSNTQETMFGLDEPLSKTDKILRIHDTPYLARNTYTGAAIRHGTEMFTDPNIPTMIGIPKVLVIVTDGEPFPDNQNVTVSAAIETVDELGIRAIAVGIGEYDIYQGLIDIGRSKDNVFLTGYDQLYDLVFKIFDLMCFVPVTVEGCQKYERTASDGVTLYFCSVENGAGVEVDFSVASGSANAYYSFHQHPEGLTVENNQGSLTDGVNSLHSPTPPADAWMKICVLIATGDAAISTFSISICPNPGVITTEDPDQTTTEDSEYPTTEDPQDTTTEDPEDTTTEDPENSTTENPDDATTEDPEDTTTEDPEDTTTEYPEDATTEDPDHTTTEDPENSTTENPEDTTTEYPEDTTTEDPDHTTTEDPEDITTENPEYTTTENPEDTTTEDPEDTTTEDPDHTTTEDPIEPPIDPGMMTLPPIDPETSTFNPDQTTTTTEEPIEPETGCGMADVVIGVDASWSIEYPDNDTSNQATGNFKENVLAFSDRLIKILDEDRYRTGFYVWSNNQKTMFGLDEHLSKPEKLLRIKSTPYLAGNTYTGAAIIHGTEMFTDTSDPLKFGIPKVLIIVTDGEPFPANQKVSVSEAVEVMDSFNIKAFAIAIGEFDNYPGLIEIAKSDEFVFPATWEELTPLAEKIAALTCFAPVVVEPCKIYSRKTGVGISLYFCSKDTMDGVNVEFSVQNGKAEAYFSFHDNPATLSVENHQGKLMDGNNSLPTEPEDQGKQICVLIITGDELENMFSINICPTSGPPTTLTTTEDPNGTTTGDTTEEPPIDPTEQPPIYPTEEPPIDPTDEPPIDPSEEPPIDPTEEPPIDPTEEPPIDPTDEPPIDPSEEPPIDPTEEPPIDPTDEPPIDPSEEPPIDPTEEPPIDPTDEPPIDPSEEPPIDPTDEPPIDPSEEPPIDPTEEPPIDPTDEPPIDPSEEPPIDPTEEPPIDPTDEPPIDPSEEPPIDPTEEPPIDPSEEPPIDPTEEPPIDPTDEPIDPSEEPPIDPTEEPPIDPTQEPPIDPSEEPPIDPTEEPPIDPTEEPPIDPSEEPPIDPTEEPPIDPTDEPPIDPSEEPPIDPTDEPPIDPSEEPPIDPTDEPPIDPSEEPPIDPTEEPPIDPTDEPPIDPSEEPPIDPTEEPPIDPSEEPPIDPTEEPPIDPTDEPIDPSEEPPIDPTEEPPIDPTQEPPIDPSEEPPIDPTEEPPIDPTEEPPIDPSEEPPIDPTEEPPIDPTDQPPIDPSEEPPIDPSEEPPIDPTEEPPIDPTEEPPIDPTEEPPIDPSEEPPIDPTEEPPIDPTEVPPIDPSEEPPIDPTEEPPIDPTEEPLIDPSEEPPIDPTEEPPIDPTDEPPIDPSEEPPIDPTEEPPTEPSKSGCGMADVILGVDASWSIEYPDEDPANHPTGNFKSNVLAFSQRLIKILNKDRYRTAFFVWSTDQKTIFELNDDLTTTEKLTKIQNTPYLAGNTYTGAAIIHGAEMFTSPNNSLRFGVPKVLVIVTDGEPFPANQTVPVSDAVQLMDSLNVRAFAVGIGQYDNFTGLKEIAKSDEYILPATWENLTPLAEKIAALTCFAPVLVDACKTYNRQTSLGISLYFCSEDTSEGVNVDFTVQNGSARGFFSFHDNPVTLSMENNQGALIEGNNSLPTEAADIGKQICVLIITGDEAENTFSINICPNTMEPITEEPPVEPEPTNEPPIDPGMMTLPPIDPEMTEDPGSTTTEDPNIMTFPPIDPETSTINPDQTATTTEQPVEPESACGMADVIIGVDASWSIEYPDEDPSNHPTGNFKNNVLAFSQRLIKILSDDRYRTGFFVWSNSQRTIFELDENLSKSEKLMMIKTTPYLAGNTYTGAAIIHGTDMFTDTDNSLRFGVPKVLIIVTDGEPFPENQTVTVPDAVQVMDSLNIRAIAVAIGQYDNYTGLRDIVKSDQDILPATWEELTPLAEKLAALTCFVPIVVEGCHVYNRKTGVGISLYFCSDETEFGVNVEFSVHGGSAQGFFSFHDQPVALSAENNQGALVVGNNSLPTDAEDRGKRICVLIITGEELENTFSINICPDEDPTLTTTTEPEISTETPIEPEVTDPPTEPETTPMEPETTPDPGPTTTLTPVNDTCGKADVVIGLDASYSINHPIKNTDTHDYKNHVLPFVSQLVAHLSNEDNFRTGVFIWSNRTRTIFELYEPLTLEEKREKIRNAPYPHENTLTAQALERGVDMLMDPNLPVRVGVPKVLIVMTDGEPFPVGPDVETVAEAMARVNAFGIRTIAVGVGNSIVHQGLLDIAPNNGDVFLSPFGSLESIASKIRNYACYIPTMAEPGMMYERTERGNYTVYFCYRSKGLLAGIAVYFKVMTGKAVAHYAFDEKPDWMTLRHKKLHKGVNSLVTVNGLGKGSRLCIMVITGPEDAVNTFRIRFDPKDADYNPRPNARVKTPKTTTVGYDNEQALPER